MVSIFAVFVCGSLLALLVDGNRLRSLQYPCKYKMKNEQNSIFSLMNRTHFEFNQNFWICFIERLPVSGCALNSSSIVSQHFRNANCLCCDCEYRRWRISMISWYCLNSPKSTVFSFSVNRKRLSSIFFLTIESNRSLAKLAGTANNEENKSHTQTIPPKSENYVNSHRICTTRLMCVPCIAEKFNTGNKKLRFCLCLSFFSAQIPKTITTQKRSQLTE